MSIYDQIYLIRNRRVMLDFELAALYGVTTSALNQAVGRNRGRFPDDFMFQLEREEFRTLISQNLISSGTYGGRRKMQQLEQAVAEHSGQIEILFQAINELLAPPEPKKKYPMGFQPPDKQK